MMKNLSNTLWIHILYYIIIILNNTNVSINSLEHLKTKQKKKKRTNKQTEIRTNEFPNGAD